ncbi:trypsin-like peptidase domain-containing protein [Streptomyces sp. A30]|uniref:nSTAND1 domain-containing NTPase n=1 Tax=Streptomyces sp. A30 TaxID=2789273 RepID=UPI0039809B79
MAPTAPDDELPRGIARFWSADGQVSGCGFLIAERTLCTCAHVVAMSLGTPETAAEAPCASLWLDFPLLHPVQERVRARVARWVPVLPDGSGDMALLRLERAVPGAAPMRIAGGDDFWDHRFRVLGFPQRTGDHGVWVQGRLRGRVGRGWTSMETRESFRGPAIGRGFSGAPVWDIEQRGVVGMTVAADHGDGATTAYLIPAAHLLDLEPALRDSPFRGLEPFREQDAAVFFGRRQDSERIVRAVRTQAFVPVAGASGVGKSSLVRAGVLPLLRASGYTVTDFTGQPGAAPVRVLLAALRDQFPEAVALAELARAAGQSAHEETAVLIGARVLEHSGPAGHVVVLDQFEETVGAEPARARELLDTLLAMTRARAPHGRRLRVLATLRSASFEELVAVGGAERLSVTVQMIAPMTPAQLTEIVAKPLDAVPGIDFEPGLADLIVTDAGTEPGALPLVEFVLSRLWAHRDRGRLTHAAYRELGGVEGALASYADQQLKGVCGLPEGPGVEVARHLFEQLALPDGDQGYARVARSYDALPPEQRAAAQSLASTRLLVIARDSTGRETVALAHESLVRQWPTLRGWLADSRGFRVWQERVRARMRDWEEGDRDPDLLLRGQEFVVAREKAGAHARELTAAEREFVELSRRQQRRVVRRGRVVVAVMVALALVAGLLVFFVQQADSRSELRDRREAADGMAAQIEDRHSGDPVAAAVMALRAYRTARTDATYRALLRMYAPMSSMSVVDGDFLDGRVEDAAASADGSRVALLHRDDDNVLRAYLVKGLFTGAPDKEELRGIPEHPDKVAVSDDGSRVGVAGQDGEVTVWSTRAVDKPLDHWTWDLAGGSEPATLALDFSSDGRDLLHSSVSGDCTFDKNVESRLYLRDIDAKSQQSVPPEVLPSEECLVDAALPAGKGATDSMITVVDETDPDLDSDSYAVRVHRLDTGKQVWSRSRLDKAVIGPGGRSLGMVAAGQVEGSYRDPVTGTRLGGSGAYRASHYEDETGRFVVTEHGTLGVWHDRVSGRKYVAPFPDALRVEDPQAYLFAVPGRDGPELRGLSGGKVIEIRELAAPSPMRGGQDEAEAAFSSSGSHLAVLVSESSEDDSVRRDTLAFVGGGRPVLRTLTPDDLPEESASFLAVSRNGHRAVVWGYQGWALFHLTSKKVTRVDRGRDPAETSAGPPLVRDVQPLGGGDFLVLGRDGVRRLDGGTGDLSSSPGSDCEERDLGRPEYCVALAVAPGEEREALVLQRDGTVRTWSLVDGSPGPSKDFGEGSDSTSGSVRYRDDGKRVAVAVGDRVVVWDPRTNHVRQLYTGSPERIALFGNDGHLVLMDPYASRSEAELWSEHNDQLIGRLEPPRSEGAWHLTDGTLHNGTEWGTWEIPLKESALAAGLCRAIGDYDPPALREDLPPAAYKKAPCPKNPR